MLVVVNYLMQRRGTKKKKNSKAPQTCTVQVRLVGIYSRVE